MSLTVEQRPQGRVLGDAKSGSVTMSGGDALFLTGYNGFSDGDYCYISSEEETYNGFWYVQKVGAGTFFIKPKAGDPHVTFARALDPITIYFSSSSHNWSAVHLPIVYKLSNDLYPTNGVDTSRTVSSFANDNGYTKLNLSGAITLDKFDTVVISGATTSSVNGVWTVIVDNSTNITINLAYDSTFDFTGATVVRYYNNYNVVVQVWAGTDSFSEKPFALVDTLYLIPDSNNEIIFSVNESLKSNVYLKNNLTATNLPANIDAFTQFYIKYAEQYDVANVKTLGSFTDDSGTFKGYGVQAKLPFKNVHSGFMSEYVSNDSNQKFLTAFNEPTFFNGLYWDISFIRNGTVGSGLELVQEYYSSGTLIKTIRDEITNHNSSVYRVQLNASENKCNYDRVDLHVSESEFSNPNNAFTSNLSGWSELTTGSSGWTWDSFNSGSAKSNTITTPSNYLGQAVSMQGELNFDFQFESVPIGSPPGGSRTRIQVTLFNIVGLVVNVVDFKTYDFTDDNIDTISDTFTTTSTYTHIGFRVLPLDVGADFAYYFSFFKISTPGQITETKTVNIKCGCDSTYEINLAWLNPYGGFDWWNFESKKKYQIDISNVQSSTKNIMSNWPTSYGEFADTIDYDVKRDSKNVVIMYAENLTLSQVQAISYIKTSPLVQIVNSVTDRRTIKIDSDSFIVYDQSEISKLYKVQIKATYTDQIPSQTA